MAADRKPCTPAAAGSAGSGSAGSAGSAPALAAGRLLGEVRRGWRRATLRRAAVHSLGLAAGTAAALALLDRASPFAADARGMLRWIPVVASLVPLAAALRRLVPGPDVRRLALLVEERVPALESVVSTTLDVTGDGPVARVFRARAEARIAMVDPGAVVPGRLRRPALALGLALLAAIVAVVATPGGVAGIRARWIRPADAARHVADGEAAPAPAAGAPVADPQLGTLRWTIRPPAYTGLPPHGWDGRAPLGALAGTRIRVEGALPATADRVGARVIGGSEPAVGVGGAGGSAGSAGAAGSTGSTGSADWSAAWTLAPGDRGLVLEAWRGEVVVARRVVPLEVRADRAPAVELLEPAVDLVVAAPRGVVVLRARARDDHGVETFRLTWVRSRGSGESFSFEEGERDWTRVRREAGALVGDVAIDLAAAGLEPGDVLHLRAVARDRNNVTGPGAGVSQTRVLRVARPDEMDQATTLVGFPIEAEQQPVLSQRMIILLTERLRDRAPSLDRAAVLEEAAEIAGEQARLRERVGDQIFARATGGMQVPDEGIAFEERSGAGGQERSGAGRAHGHEGKEEARPPAGATPEEVLAAAARATGTGALEEVEHRHDADPIVAVNQPLLQAYNAMWASERALRQGDAGGALPHQHEALRILQELRQAERVFLRARQRVAPVDIAAARGSGRVDDAGPARRSPAPPAPTTEVRLGELESVAARIRTVEPRLAALELADLAARLLADAAADPEAAAWLAGASDAAARGEPDEAVRLTLRARARLAPAAAAGTAPSVASAVDPASAEYFRRLGRRP